MQIIVMSDTHGEIERARELFHTYLNADLFVHCGDIGYAYTSMYPCAYVRGNHDLDVKLPTSRVLQEQGHQILLTHGHLWEKEIFDDITGYADMTYEQMQSSWRIKLEKCLCQEAKKQGCDIVFYGHTHVATATKQQGIWLVNPGSLGFQQTYAVVTINQEIEVVIKRIKGE